MQQVVSHKYLSSLLSLVCCLCVFCCDWRVVFVVKEWIVIITEITLPNETTIIKSNSTSTCSEHHHNSHQTNTPCLIIIIHKQTVLARTAIPRIPRYASPPSPPLTSLPQRPTRLALLLRRVTPVSAIIRFVLYSSLPRGSLTLLLRTGLRLLLLLLLRLVQRNALRTTPSANERLLLVRLVVLEVDAGAREMHPTATLPTYGALDHLLVANLTAAAVHAAWREFLVVGGKGGRFTQKPVQVTGDVFGQRCPRSEIGSLGPPSKHGFARLFALLIRPITALQQRHNTALAANMGHFVDLK